MRGALCPRVSQGSAYGAGNASACRQRAAARRQMDSMDSNVGSVEEMRQSFPCSSQRMGNKGIFETGCRWAMFWLRRERSSFRLEPRATSKELNSQTAAISSES